MRLAEACWLAIAAGLALTQLSCMVLPVRTAPGVTGRVVDAASGEPLAGALVVLRFDLRHGELLPDREQLGYAEARSDAEGRFRVGRMLRPGLSLWPLFRSEARVVAVLREGYRCPPPSTVPSSGEVRMALAPALDLEEQQDSCRPVAARPGQAEAYMAAWRSLHREPRQRREARRSGQRTQRLLQARAALGFGANCTGPVLDLVLAPGGERVAWLEEGPAGPEVQLLETTPGGPGGPQRVGKAEDAPPRRLAWTGPDELVLWQPSSDIDRSISPSIFAPGRSELVWTASTARPVRLDPGTPGSSRRTSPRQPLDPEDLRDEADSFWHGRSFDLERSVDPHSGLPRERLLVTGPAGERRSVPLPGETCGPAGRFGRPQYRITADGRTALDLRFVDGACHAVRIDLENGQWLRLDSSEASATCRTERRIPPTHLRRSLRGYMREVEAALEASGADSGTAWAIEIGPSGETLALARGLDGEPRSVALPRFPISTPLRRIDLSNVAPSTPQLRRSTVPSLEPL